MDDALRKDFDLRIGAKPMNSRHPRIAVHRQRLVTEWPKNVPDWVARKLVPIQLLFFDRFLRFFHTARVEI